MSTIEPMKKKRRPPHALLREKREAANLSLTDLAKEVGCSTAAVSRWESEDENMRRKPELPNALRLQKVLKISPTVWL